MVYRHFGPKTLQHHRDGSKMSGQYGTGAEVSIQQFSTSSKVSIQPFGTSAELSALCSYATFQRVIASKNEQSYALYRYSA